MLFEVILVLVLLLVIILFVSSSALFILFNFLFKFSCFTAFDSFLIKELNANLLSCWLNGVVGILSKSLFSLFSLFSGFVFLLFNVSIILFDISFKFSLSSLFSVFLTVSMIFNGIFSTEILSSLLICSYKKFKIFVLYSSSSSIHIFSMRG